MAFLQKLSIHLRAYQDEDFVDLLKEVGEKLRSFVLHYATGGGKTIMGLALAAKLIVDRVFNYAVVITPTTAVRDHFSRYSNSIIKWSGGEFKIGLVEAVKDGKEFRTKFGKRGRILALTHSLFIEPKVQEYVIDHLKRNPAKKFLLLVDEAQHSPVGTDILKLGHAEDTLRAAGVIIGKLTGTPYRSDKLPVVLKEDFVCTRSLVDLMLAGMCPQEITSEIVHVKGGGTSNDDAILIPIDIHEGALTIKKLWNRFKRLPAILRLKPRGENDNKETIAEIKRVIGNGVIKCYGEKENVPEFFRALEREAEHIKLGIARYSMFQTIFIGISRIVEGVDSPSRCLAFLYGIPKSMVLFEQFLGRILRNKFRLDGITALFKGYPKKWLNKVHLIFVVGGVEDAAARREEHMGILFRALALVDSLNSASFLGKLFRNFYDGMSPSRKREISTEISNLYVVSTDKENQTQFELKQLAQKWIENHESPLDEGRYASLGPGGRLYCLKTWAEVHKIEIDEIAFSAFLALDFARVHKKAKEKLLQLLQSLKEDLSGTVLAQLLALFEEFKNEVPEIEEEVYKIDIQLLESVRIRAKSIITKVQPLGSLEELKERVDLFFSTQKRYPTIKDWDPVNPEISFRTHHEHLRSGLYKGFRGDLSEWIVLQSPWVKHTIIVNDLYNDWVVRRKSPPILRAEIQDKGPDKITRIRTSPHFGRYPIVVDHWGAINLAGVCPDENFLSNLTPKEAHQLGTKPKKVIDEVYTLFQKQGNAALHSRLENL